jgi:hypothetical protein
LSPNASLSANYKGETLVGMKMSERRLFMEPMTDHRAQCTISP